MAAFSEFFVDPSLDSDTGTGTLVDPYGDAEHGIREETFDTVGGTIMHIKEGAAEVLSDDFATAMADTGSTPAWLTSTTAAFVIKGYRGVAHDGGKAAIDGNGLHGMFGVSNINYAHAIDLRMFNTGAEIAIKMAAGGSVQRCEVHDCNVNAVQVTNYGVVIGNYIHNIGAVGISCGGTGASAIYNRIEDGVLSMTVGVSSFGSVCERNIVILKANSNATGILGTSAPILNNSVYCHGGGTGIGIRGASGSREGHVFNNLIEGISGVGGRGIQSISNSGKMQAIGGNEVFDCTTPFIYEAPVVEDWGDNNVLTASPFVNAAVGDFRPVDISNIREGHVPGGWFI